MYRLEASMYRLEVSEYAGPLAWRFQLFDATGDAVAEHRVELKPAAWEFEAFTELYGYLRRYAVPDRRLASEQQLVTALGDWITNQALGAVAGALAATPCAAEHDEHRPWHPPSRSGRLADRSAATHGANSSSSRSQDDDIGCVCWFRDGQTALAEERQMLRHGFAHQSFGFLPGVTSSDDSR
jgi:hypothetical protein